MKSKFLTLLIAITMVMAPRSSSALILKAIEEAYNVIPLSPVINFGEDIAETGKLLNKTALKVQKLAIQIKKDIITLKVTALNIVKQVEDAFKSGDFSAIIGLSDPKATVTVCGADMTQTNHSGMAQKLQEILLTYGIGEKEIVDRNRRKFYLDNIYNIYAAVQVLKYDISENGEIGKQIFATQDCCGNGNGVQCGLPDISNGGNNEMLMYYGYALATLENLVKTWERVSALKAKLRAIETILDVELKPDFVEKVSQAEPMLSPIYYASAQTVYSEPLAFAQMVYNDNSVSDFDTIIEEDEQAAQEHGFTGLGMKFVAPAQTLPESPYNQHIAETNSYREISDVENAMSEALSIHNKIRNIDDYVQTAKQYKNTLEQYKKKLEILNDSNQCAVNYIKRYFVSPDNVWAGKRLSKEEINDYDLRKGISGWAIDAYEVAKAGETTIDDDNFKSAVIAYEEKKSNTFNAEVNDDSAVEKVSGKDVDLSDVDNIAKSYQDNSAVNNADLEQEVLSDDDLKAQEEGNYDLDTVETNKVENKEDDYNSGKGVGAEKSKETQYENRKATMIAWQIGAMSSEDLSLEADKWGQTTDRKMIWNDAKIFYNQYLDRKYENMKEYLKRYTTADVVSMFISIINNGVLDNAQTSYQNELNALYDEANTKLHNIIAQNEAEVETQIDPSLITEREEYESKINILDQEIKLLSQEIDIMSSNAEDNAYTYTDKKASETINYLDDEEKEDFNKLEDLSGAVKSRSMANKQNMKDENGKNLDDKIAQLKDKKVEFDRWQKLLEDVNTRIVVEKLSKQEELSSSADTQIARVIQEFKNERVNKKRAFEGSISSQLNTALQPIKESDGLIAFNRIKRQINNEAERAVNVLNEAVERIIDDGLAEIHELDDDLYLPLQSTKNKVNEIHQKIITQLKTLTISASVSGYSIPAIIAFADLEIMTTSPDNTFFVGALPRDLDFRAPRPMESFSQPPVREVFHFDMTDFANVKPYNEDVFDKYSAKGFARPSEDKKKKMRAISRGDFFNYGGKIPDLWQLMLKRKAFVESEFKLEEALNQGCEAVAFLRGGIMPCRVDETDVVLDVYVFNDHDNNKFTYDFQSQEKYIKRTDVNPEDLPKCILIDMKENKPYLTYYDIKAGIISQSEQDKPPLPAACNASELGMILDADEDNNIYFQPFIYEAYNDNFRAQNSQNPSKEDNRNLAISDQAQLSRNQIGDFLRQAESEKKMKQSLEEIKRKKDEQLQELTELLASYNITLGKNIDLSNEENINKIKSYLREAREMALNFVAEKINAVRVSLNEAKTAKEEDANEPAEDEDNLDLIESRLKNIESLKEFILKKEKNEYDSEYVDITMSTIVDEDLKKEVKNAKADKTAQDKYDKKSKKRRKDTGDDKDYQDLEEAYCANY